MDRISEVLFGLIMVLTYTSTLSVVTADRIQISTMLIGALGCNLAWGIIDAAMYLMARLHEKGRNDLDVACSTRGVKSGRGARCHRRCHASPARFRLAEGAIGVDSAKTASIARAAAASLFDQE